MKTIDDYMELPYAEVLQPERCIDTFVYVAYNPELPGCMAQGDTIKEASANLKKARREYIELKLKLGWEIPLPVESS